MGVDGFSMASVGLPKDITSAQVAASTEQHIISGDEKVVNKIDRALNKKINNDENKEHKHQFFEDGFQEEDDEENSDQETEDSSKDAAENNSEEFDKNLSNKSSKVKKYKPYEIKDPENVIVRYNDLNDKIELYNKSTQKAVETIKPKDFVEMVTKLDYNSGILVNKKI